MTTTALATPTATRRDPADPTRNNARAGGHLLPAHLRRLHPRLLLLDPDPRPTPTTSSAPARTPRSCGPACSTSSPPWPASAPPSRCSPWSSDGNESMALGFVMSRMIEAAVIMIGVVAPAHRRDPAPGPRRHGRRRSHPDHDRPGAGRRPGLDVPVRPGLHGLLQRGPVRHPAVPLRPRPRIIPTIGLVGAPLLLDREPAQLLRPQHPGYRLDDGPTLPIAAWELSVGFYMAFKGFRREGVERLAG